MDTPQCTNFWRVGSGALLVQSFAPRLKPVTTRCSAFVQIALRRTMQSIGSSNVEWCRRYCQAIKRGPLFDSLSSSLAALCAAQEPISKQKYTCWGTVMWRVETKAKKPLPPSHWRGSAVSQNTLSASNNYGPNTAYRLAVCCLINHMEIFAPYERACASPR